MRKNKVGSIFLVSMLALAGLGMSYAGFSDSISVFGTVSTATVTLDIFGYSGWWVYKDLTNDLIVQSPTPLTDPDLVYVAHSQAKPGTGDNVVDMEWVGIFPCIYFVADVQFHYKGSIPAKVRIKDMAWEAEGYNFNEYLTMKAYKLVDNAWVEITPWVWDSLTEYIQVHNCDRIRIDVIIHLAQLDILQGETGGFSFKIEAKQWNE